MGNCEKVVVCAFISGFGWELCRKYDFLDDCVSLRLPLATFLGAEESCLPVILTGRMPFETGHLSFSSINQGNSAERRARVLKKIPDYLASRGSVKRLAAKVACGFPVSQRFFKHIPLKYLPFFAWAGSGDVFTRAGIKSGVPTVLDYLAENDVPFFIPRRDASDEENARRLRQSLMNREVAFAFISFKGIKASIAENGTCTETVESAVRGVEESLRGILSLAKDRYREVVFFFFSDQGMADIREKVDVEARIKETGLEFGRQYVAFYEPTMVRFWFFCPEARERIIDVLEATPEGDILSDYDLEELSCFFPDRRFGDLFFLMKSGTGIFPNYVNNGEIKATYGYSPYDRHSIACFGSAGFDLREPTRLSDLFGLMLDSVRSS